MKYLSIDIEATGLDQDDLMIEFAAIPFDVQKRELARDLAFHSYIQCPSFETLRPKLNPWVIEHNEKLIRKANQEGHPLKEFRSKFEQYLKRPELIRYFDLGQKNEKIILFGKSLNAIDLPFLNRDLGFGFMREYFSHRVLDLSSTAFSLVDAKLLPEQCRSGSELMKQLGLGEVNHTALEDAINTARMYLLIMEKISPLAIHLPTC